MTTVNYKTSGVDIDRANGFVKAIQASVRSTYTKDVLKRKGAFGGLYSLAKGKYKDPVLVSSSDGVGTKLLIANAVNKHDSVGIDLVAMNVNDILCVGARPLFFLDYIACGKLEPKILQDVVKGIAAGCRQSGCGLIGGETAEMPGMYKAKDYDLAGFAVGVVDKKYIIDGSKIKQGDRVIGLASSGLHSNGFSLVRKVFTKAEQKKYAAELLKPTRIYVKEILDVIKKFNVRGLAHNTGGAFYDKLTKIVPEGLCLSIDAGSWRVPEIFLEIQRRGKVKNKDMFSTFNMGIGMILVVRAKEVKGIRSLLSRKRLRSFEIGEVAKNQRSNILIQY